MAKLFKYQPQFDSRKKARVYYNEYIDRYKLDIWNDELEEWIEYGDYKIHLSEYDPTEFKYDPTDMETYNLYFHITRDLIKLLSIGYEITGDVYWR